MTHVISRQEGERGKGHFQMLGFLALLREMEALFSLPALPPAAASTIGRATRGSPATSGECGRSHCPMDPTENPPSRTDRE